MGQTPGIVRACSEGPLGWVIFENAARLNALSEDMSQMAEQIVRGFSADDDIRVVILRGAGKKAFVSGGDISKFENNQGDVKRDDTDRANYDALKLAIRKIEKPVLAMIYGYCLGGGLGLALSADVRLAASSAKLGIPAAKRGLGYPWPYMHQLVGIVGPAVAKDMIFSGRQIEAREAARLGLVNRVVATEALEQETRKYAAILAENAPLTIRAAKYCIDELTGGEGNPDRERMQALIDAANNSEDFREATRSFMEKRKPVFRGM